MSTPAMPTGTIRISLDQLNELTVAMTRVTMLVSEIMEAHNFSLKIELAELTGAEAPEAPNVVNLARRSLRRNADRLARGGGR